MVLMVFVNNVNRDTKWLVNQNTIFTNRHQCCMTLCIAVTAIMPNHKWSSSLFQASHADYTSGTYSCAIGVNDSCVTDCASKVTIAIRKPDLHS